MKKDKYNYFDEFILMADNIIKSAEILKDFLGNFNLEKLEEKIKEVHTLENESDHIIHQMRNYLLKDI